MPSKLGIANHALMLMGEDSIDDFDGTTGEVLETVYDRMVEELLTDHRWRFAIKKVALSEASGSPVNEWTKHFDLPSDYVLIIRTYPRSLYEIYEDKLLTNNSSASIDYIFDPGVKAYPEYFCNVLAHKIAAETALGITQNQSLADILLNKYFIVLGNAKHKDSQGRPPSAIQQRPYIDIRS